MDRLRREANEEKESCESERREIERIREEAEKVRMGADGIVAERESMEFVWC